jgi:uncharacterized membrane protein (UPF0136 family)
MKASAIRNRKPVGRAQRDSSEKVLIALEVFTGLTGVAGGVLLMARPDGSLLQIPPATLSALARTSPFPDFFVPGLFLAGIVGGGMLGAAWLLSRRRPYALEAAIVAGTALIIFEVVEFAAIGFMPLQALEVVVGAVTLGLAVYHRSAKMRPQQHAVR